MMNAVGDVKRASFEGILLALIRPVLAKIKAQTLIEALGRAMVTCLTQQNMSSLEYPLEPPHWEVLK